MYAHFGSAQREQVPDLARSRLAVHLYQTQGHVHLDEREGGMRVIM